MRFGTLNLLIKSFNDLVECESVEGFGEIEGINKVVIPVIKMLHIFEIVR